MPRVPVPVVGDAYADTVAPFAAQETTNWVPEKSERQGTRTVTLLKTPDGLQSFSTVGAGTVRGNITMAGVAYVVADTMLYSVASDGTETALGTIEGSGRVGIAENGTQVVVVNGPKGWVYEPGGVGFVQITDPDFPGAVDCFFIGQYVVFIQSDTDEWFISALADVTSFDALDFARAETLTDELLGGVALSNNVVLFGERSIEVWQNTGAADFPFERIAVVERGIAAAFAKALLDNTVFWLGNDGIAYRANGYQPERISTRPIEQAFAAEELSEAFCLGYEKGGHAFFVVSFPNGKTWVYDAAHGAWHRRKSFELARWRANTYLFAYGRHLVGDFQSGRLWELKDDVYTEGDDPIVSERKTQYLSKDGEYGRMSEFELVFNAGQGLATGQGSAPLIDFCYSDDGGRTFKNWRQTSLGLIGKYAGRARFHGLGRSRQRMFWLRVSDLVRRDVMGAEAVIA